MAMTPNPLSVIAGAPESSFNGAGELLRATGTLAPAGNAGKLFAVNPTGTGVELVTPGGGGTGTFDPTITSASDGQVLIYDAFQAKWINSYGIVARPTIAVSGSGVSVTSTFKTFLDLGSQNGVQYKLYSDVALTTLVHDTGILNAGAGFDFTAYITPPATYYVIGRVRESNYGVFSSYSEKVDLVAVPDHVLQNVGIYMRVDTEPAAAQDSINWYTTNGQNWSVAQRLAVSNNQASTLGTQTLPNGTSYTFNDGVYVDGLGGWEVSGATLVADLGSSKAVTGIRWRSVSSNTPGGWGDVAYINGNEFSYWSGSAWVAIGSALSGYTNPIGTTPVLYEPNFSVINARFFRVRNLNTYTACTTFQLFGV